MGKSFPYQFWTTITTFGSAGASFETVQFSPDKFFSHPKGSSFTFYKFNAASPRWNLILSFSPTETCGYIVLDVVGCLFATAGWTGQDYCLQNKSSQ